ncbi:MAG TPA: aminoacetone oxidase family FAD-binding enzyme [Candidatus Limnocylindrales bacterium]|nr:aminoacetone oxidase family FAD-binding enzyme [Candidatus Limnocylindrales bacterium]
MRSDPIIIVGAGAAGLMAAIFAAGAGAPVVLLERTRDGGRKILISGGGRCNVLPSRLEESRFVTASSPNAMRKMIRSWPLAEQRTFFEVELGVALALEPDSGKLFPVSNRAREVRDALVAAAAARGAELRGEHSVVGVRRLGDAFEVELENRPPLRAAAVILATGGLSVPNTGSDGTGLRIAGELGHELRPTYPALTPLVQEPARYRELAGVSCTATLSAGRTTSRGGFLFTHRGFSGPSVLDVSHVATRDGGDIHVQWTERTRQEWEEMLRPQRAGVAGVLRRHLPARLADALMADAGIPAERSLADLRAAERRAIVESLTRWRLPWTGHEGYRKAEVTGGGVDLGEVDPRTMQSRRCPGLFLCGEMLDAFGPIGGYNFLWAWATGRAAGLGALTATGVFR